MASTLLPSARDQENRMMGSPAIGGKASIDRKRMVAKIGGGSVRISGPAPQKKFGLQGLKLQNTKTMQGRGGGAAGAGGVSGGRTFGDISNRLGSGGTGPATPAINLKPKHSKLAPGTAPSKLPGKKFAAKTTSQTKTAGVRLKGLERDFFPEITEIDDYLDVLPPHLIIGREALQKLLVPSAPVFAPSEDPLLLSPPPSPSTLALDSPLDLGPDLSWCSLEHVDDLLELPMPLDW